MDRPMNLNIKEMLSGDINNLRYVKRYGVCLTTHIENVAEHSYYVALYGLLIGMWAKSSGTDLSLEAVLWKALVHDIDEAKTGDFQRDFKYSSQALKAVLDKEAGHQAWSMLSQLIPEGCHETTMLYTHFLSAKSDTPEGCVIAFADFLAVVSFLWAEVRGTNFTTRKLYETIGQYSSIFDYENFDFLRPLVVEAQDIVAHIVKKSKEIVL